MNCDTNPYEYKGLVPGGSLKKENKQNLREISVMNEIQGIMLPQVDVIRAHIILLNVNDVYAVEILNRSLTRRWSSMIQVTAYTTKSSQEILSRYMSQNYTWGNVNRDRRAKLNDRSMMSEYMREGGK